MENSYILECEHRIAKALKAMIEQGTKSHEYRSAMKEYCEIKIMDPLDWLRKAKQQNGEESSAS